MTTVRSGSVCWRPRWPAAPSRWRPADPGEPAWTDGITVFVDAAESAAQQLESVTVQASLLAGGGLEPDVVRKLVRRPALAKKYLAVEGQRALAANEDLLPYPVRSLIDLDLATRTDSPATSLTVAGRDKVADPPASFGVIKAAQPAGGARELLSSRMWPAPTTLVASRRRSCLNSRTTPRTPTAPT